MYKYLRTQFGLIAIFLYWVIYNIIPFFTLKNIYLRLSKNKIGKDSYIHTWVRFTWIGNIEIGEDSTINFGCLLDNRKKINLGNHVMIGHNSKIYTMGHDINDPLFLATGGCVTIKDYAVIFPNTLIMPNITIGQGAVVYPGSVVTKDVDNYDVVGGNPATFIKKRNDKLEYKINYGFWFVNS
jgi:acetyltransferase-like isoleucine patch superfamily enzyme